MRTFVRSVLTAWLGAALLECLLLPTDLRTLSHLDGIARMSFPRLILVTAVFSAILLLISRRFPRLDPGRWGIPVLFVLLAAAVLPASFSWAFLAACILVGILLTVYGICGADTSQPRPADAQPCHPAFPWITAGLAVLFFAFVAVWTVCRVYAFCTPTFDFGIFAQMFHSMKETGLPVTTLERNGALSHFHVHVSPIWYLLLPFYMLFPAPATLQVLQALVLATAVIPLWLLAKHHGLSGVSRTLLCAILLVYPAYSGGASYDIHENCFLTPLILWMFYAADTKKTWLLLLSACLTLTVKEDAAVYVAVIALWMMLDELLKPGKADMRRYVSGTAMLLGALGYFFAVTSFLANIGDGVMTGRYRNLMPDASGSLVSVVKTALLSPMKLLYECADAEKLPFIALTLLPLLLLPFFTRRYERFVLLIPYLLFNLLSDYPYQHDIFFQYTYGSAAFLLYLCVVNAADLRRERIRICALGAAAVIGAACFGAVVVPKAIQYPKYAVEYADHYARVRETLAFIPDDAPVTATAFFTTELSDREILYDPVYTDVSLMLETEYAVFASAVDQNPGSGTQKRFVEYVHAHLGTEYEIFAELEGSLVIYKKIPAEQAQCH